MRSQSLRTIVQRDPACRAARVTCAHGWERFRHRAWLGYRPGAVGSGQGGGALFVAWAEPGKPVARVVAPRRAVMGPSIPDLLTALTGDAALRVPR
jgi:hypothetical protein